MSLCLMLTFFLKFHSAVLQPHPAELVSASGAQRGADRRARGMKDCDDSGIFLHWKCCGALRRREEFCVATLKKSCGYVPSLRSEVMRTHQASTSRVIKKLSAIPDCWARGSPFKAKGQQVRRPLESPSHLAEPRPVSSLSALLSHELSHHLSGTKGLSLPESSIQSCTSCVSPAFQGVVSALQQDKKWLSLLEPRVRDGVGGGTCSTLRMCPARKGELQVESQTCPLRVGALFFFHD
ncbi:uncharacterized protein LOC106509328 isoform X2 [Sus scrofa]|uniref:uncharacterized protein LOC106509328 isoform X2 n=1 Tax=Sus scrofa TaxID=9823 RepID=UPI000A2B309B|nr:uncharacterized protein LOC106509328 isoform X2 [Sus scrofa]